MKKIALMLLLPALLVACTGTDETPPVLRLAVLTDGGRTLGYVPSNASYATAPQGTVSLEGDAGGGVVLDSLDGGRRLLLTRRGGLEARNYNLAGASAFAQPGFTPCLTQTVQNALRDRVLTLSDCNGLQQLVLYRNDGSLVWTAVMPTPPLPIPSSDLPPTRIAAGPGNTAVLSRAALSGGSEVVFVTPRNTGDAVQDAVAVVASPIQTVSIRDLAPFGSAIYAATDTGVRPLLASGPDAGTSPVNTAFGPARVDRLWSGTSGTRTLLAAWRNNRLSNTGGEYLRLWDGSTTSNGTVTSAVNVAYFSDLRDVEMAVDGRLYALTSNTLTSYDTVLGLSQNSWSAAQLLSGLNDARSLTWLVQ